MGGRQSGMRDDSRLPIPCDSIASWRRLGRPKRLLREKLDRLGCFASLPQFPDSA